MQTLEIILEKSDLSEVIEIVIKHFSDETFKIVSKYFENIFRLLVLCSGY